MAATFGAVFANHLATRDWSQRAFARHVGASQSLVARVIGGSRRPPLEQISEWIAALDLSDQAAAELARLAIVAHDAAPLLDLMLVRRPARAADRGAAYDGRRRLTQ